MQILQSATRPIQELWNESYIALNEIEVPAGISLGDPFRDITNFFIIIALVGFLIIGHRRILQGFSIVSGAIANNKKLLAIDNQSNLQVCRNTLFMFLTLCSSFILANIAPAIQIIGSNFTLPVRFAGILGFFALFVLARKLIMQFMCWVNATHIFKIIHRISFTYACLWYIIILFCFCAIKSISFMPMESMHYCLLFSLLPVMALYFFSIFRIFISKGFSPFFYILYLCTLEILPIVMLLYLNFN